MDNCTPPQKSGLLLLKTNTSKQLPKKRFSKNKWHVANLLRHRFKYKTRQAEVALGPLLRAKDLDVNGLDDFTIRGA
ncbi:MAG: hypothetical protein M3342_02085 [Bacteroidota bacterium]|nr:hypothetical protein [Flavisolibacter sp.]MBD0295346.1 hypothetical protein [Flavisolibacter sp.]MBD0375060.1 hypothetical protein [Flavisolibacter sp.]MDQ3842792.1 hypothetical protein [Bacteroidota bacterium]